MFSQTLEYALRVMIHLAYQQNQPVTTKQIAVVTKVPEGYLAKVIQALNKAGLVHSQRGLHGGSVLARPPEQITIYDIVAVVDPIKRINTCPLGLKSHGVNLCPLHKRMDQALDSVERAFKESTLADVMADPNTSKPLCEAPEFETVGGKVARLTVKR
ncbi:MAG TPA: Rrf2 family transcriptional regulator [Humisphaera sp.]